MGTFRVGERLQHPTIGGIMNRAAAEQNWFKSQMSEMGHETTTMIWNDLTIADYYGQKAVRDTYAKFIKAIGSYDARTKKTRYNEQKLSELYIALNWKINVLYDKDKPLAEFYNGLWEECYAFATSHLDSEQLRYFYSETD